VDKEIVVTTVLQIIKERMPLLGFSMGSSGGGETEKSLDEIIAERRKEQAKASSGRGGGPSNKNNSKVSKKDKLVDRSVATGRAKRAAAVKAKRGISNTNKPSHMDVEREAYRQSRKTTESKKKLVSLRGKNKKNNNNSNVTPIFGRMPSKKQIEAAIQGMEANKCPPPDNHTLVMQFVPVVASTTTEGKGKRGGGKAPNSKKSVGRGGRK